MLGPIITGQLRQRCASWRALIAGANDAPRDTTPRVPGDTTPETPHQTEPPRRRHYRFVCGVEVQRHGADRGCRAVLDGQGELVIDEAPVVEVRVAPGVKFTRATERLLRAHLRATLARVVQEHDGDVIGALELG